jgi:hypothetical protein
MHNSYLARLVCLINTKNKKRACIELAQRENNFKKNFFL